MTISNTFAIPSIARSFTLSLIDFNNTFLALWSNFYGPSVPNINNMTISGAAVTPYEGMLYRSSLNKSFYVYDPTNTKGGSIGGGFTRTGIGSRNFESITTLVSSIASIEQGELLTTVGDSSANYRVYMKTNNSNAIVDIGSPGVGSLVTNMFVDRQISNTRLIANTITTYEIAPYTIVGDKLANNLVYSSFMNITSNLNMSGNVVFTSASKGLRFFDGSKQNTAGLVNFANVGTGASFVAYKSANSNLIMRTGSTSLTFTPDSLGTGTFNITNDNTGNLIWALTLGTGVGGVGVGVGVGVGTGK